jgi:hypothetical protein
MKTRSLHKPVTKDLPREWGGRNLETKVGQYLVRAVGDSGTTSPIVPQELSPEVIPIFVDSFPLFDMIEKEPSNGLSHTYQQQTAFSLNSAPSFISENGAVSDDQNVYVRQTSNIGIPATRRGVSIKAQAAGQQAGGPGSDLMGRELKGGLTTIARDTQNVLLRYQEVFSSETTTTAEDGAYLAVGFNGLRYVLNQLSPAANTVEVDITSPWTDQRVLKAVRLICNQIYDTGGKIDLLIANTTGSEAMFEDQFDLVRWVNADADHEIIPGLSVRAISTDQGLVPVLVVPGNAIGTWLDNSSNVYQDIIAVDTETLKMPYLGNPLPSVLRIPIGTDGTLRELAIPFAMYGLACMAPQYMGRVSLKIADG